MANAIQPIIKMSVPKTGANAENTIKPTLDNIKTILTRCGPKLFIAKDS